MKQKSKSNTVQRGQSLVEVALFLPIFIIIIAGLVEVSHILVTQNRVTSAARASARFAADGGEDDGMVQVALSTVTQTLELEEDVWDIWSVRGVVNGAGNGFVPNTWSFNHIYGISNTTRFDDVDQALIQQQVLQELQTDQNGNTSQQIAANIRFVGTYAIHDIDSILGLNALPQYAEISSVRELTVMRISGLNQQNTNGCDAFPIAVQEDLRSVTQAQYPTSKHPQAPPLPAYNSFFNHEPNQPFSLAPEGSLFLIYNGMGQGNFGWLVWNEGINASSGTLGDSLAWPGNSTNYAPYGNGNGGAVDGSGFNFPVAGYIEPGDPTDQTLHINDWVRGSTGSVNSDAVRGQLNTHIQRDRTLRVLLWNNAQGSGSNGVYQISGFAIMRLISYNITGGESWILAEFIRLDNSCGQPSNLGNNP